MQLQDLLSTNLLISMQTKKQEPSRCPCSFHTPSLLANTSSRAKLLFFNWKLMTPLPMSLSSPTPPSLARPSLTSGTTGLLLTKILTSQLMLAVSTSKWRICSTAKLINLPRLSTSSSTRTLTSSSRTSSLPSPSPSLASSRVSTTVPSGTLMLVYSNSSLLSSILSVSNYLYLTLLDMGGGCISPPPKKCSKCSILML